MVLINKWLPYCCPSSQIAVIISGRHSKIHEEEYGSGMLEDLVSVHWYGSNDQVR